jgi:hypothetical protein
LRNAILIVTLTVCKPLPIEGSGPALLNPPRRTLLVMPNRARFVVALYEPRTETACDALAMYLGSAGLKTSIDLPGPWNKRDIEYGVQRYASFRLALPNGKQPSEDVVEAAVNQAYAKLKTRFGDAAVDLNGTLIGAIRKTP